MLELPGSHIARAPHAHELLPGGRQHTHGARTARVRIIVPPRTTELLY